MLLRLAVVLLLAGGRSWARSLEEEPTESVMKPVKGVVTVGVRDKGMLPDIVQSVLANNTVGFNARETPNWAVLDTATRNLQQWLAEYTDDTEEGRHLRRKRMMLQMLMWLKTLGLGVVLPVAVAIALFAAWKGITISLLALMLAGIVGIKGLVASASSKATTGQPQHVILSGVPSHHDHYWRRRSDHPSEDTTSWTGPSSHRVVYRAYAS